jgi:hypothetical protein
MRACILNQQTKVVEAIIMLDSVDPALFVPYKSGIELSTRHDGELGWTLLPNGDWSIPPDDRILWTPEQKIRNIRDFRLKESDKYAYPDFPLTEEKRNEWIVYRQALRDITSQPGFPNNVVWPTKPN